MRDIVTEILESDIKLMELYRENAMFNVCMHHLRNNFDYNSVINIIADLCKNNEKLSNELFNIYLNSKMEVISGK